jgi:pilus assembly protein CpaC
MTWGALLLFVAATVTPALGADGLGRIRDQEIQQTLRLRVGQSKVLRTPFALTRVSVANPDVADIILTSEREIYINGQTPGVTNLSLWGKSRFTSARVTVEADVTLLKEKLAQVLPKEKIAVQAADESIVLSGEVTGPIAQQTAVALALPFVGNKKDKVINLLNVGGVQQVMVEVRLAEINRSVLNRIGVNFTAFDQTGQSFGVQQLASLTSISDFVRGFTGTTLTQTIGPNVNALAGFRTGTWLWTVFFDVLKQNGLGRILAEPNLVTTSGQEASFLAGGEFPIPVPQQFQTITIEYKKFGVGLVVLPTVLDGGKIALKVSPEVSQLDFTQGQTLVTQGFVVPGLSVRRMSTHIEVQDGQTFAIAGLLSDQHRTVINKYPVLGSLPVLGTLFRSSSFQKSETELVVLVTPHLVKPISATAARLPTDKYIEPSNMEFYLLGLDQGRARTAPTTTEKQQSQLPPAFGRRQVE